MVPREWFQDQMDDPYQSDAAYGQNLEVKMAGAPGNAPERSDRPRANKPRPKHLQYKSQSVPYSDAASWWVVSQHTIEYRRVRTPHEHLPLDNANKKLSWVIADSLQRQPHPNVISGDRVSTHSAVNRWARIVVQGIAGGMVGT